jgi:C4-dicarboxylate-specific signal transduction histidine kinase
LAESNSPKQLKPWVTERGSWPIRGRSTPVRRSRLGWLQIRIAPEWSKGTVQDITDETRAREESIAKQKWESLGRLAGGVAHDFNSLLSSALAQAESALAELASGSLPEEELQAIRDVAIRGSEIVHQLMVYAGKESVAVSLVDVSRIVEETSGIRRARTGTPGAAGRPEPDSLKAC